MCFKGKINKFIGFLLLIYTSHAQESLEIRSFSTVVCGNAQIQEYLPLLANKRVGVITNVTGVIGSTSIVDSLLKLKVNIKKIFGPEHGFRSDTDAGEKVKSGKDKKTGITVISLYGKNKKPTKEQLADLDVVIYDIQDIGVRFYTYISTMCYAMEACAENKKQFIVLDRPNPNGFYIDGPVLRNEWKSFLGLHNVPLVYGMTCGEYAKMVNGEGWLKGGIKCDLKIIKLEKYDRKCSYDLPVRPSPNIPNSDAVLLYPGLGLFEGSIVSLGRGTDFPFQVIGYPGYRDSTFCFTPKESKVSKTPKYLGQVCCGVDLRKERYLKKHPHVIEISWLMKMCASAQRDDFFDENFNYHAGNAELKEQILSQTSPREIRTSWYTGLLEFKAIRIKYLLYPDF
jgi:uncharacterized protein YbbC (DUF1343 family)